MKISRIVALLLLFVACASAAGEADKLRLALISCGGGGDRPTDFLFEISKTKMEALPKWHPESESPAPLSLKRACELGRATLKISHPRIDEFEVAEVRMKESISTKHHGTWFYELSYRGKREGKTVGSCGLFAVILMDGTSVEPVVSRQNP